MNKNPIQQLGQKLTESDYNALLSSLNQATLVSMTDGKGNIIYANQKFVEVSKYSLSELIGQNHRILKSGHQPQELFIDLWQTISSGKVWRGEIKNKAKDGSYYWVDTSIAPILNSIGKPERYISVRFLITDKKKIEEDRSEKLKELEDTKTSMLSITEDLDAQQKKLVEARIKDEALLSSIGDGVVALDPDGHTMMMNKVAEGLLGWKSQDLMGKSWFEAVPLEDEEGTAIPSEKRPLQASLTHSKSTTTTTTTTTTSYYYIRKDKTKFPVQITATQIILKGKIIGAIEVFRDITKEKEIDKAKSEFISLASHQLRTPLGIAKWYLEVLNKEDYMQQAPKTTQEYLNEVYKSNERVLALVRDLLSVSRIDQGRVKDAPKLVNILEIITDTVGQMQVIAKSKKVTLHLELKAQKLHSMYLDPLRFHEVIENLVANAIEYTEALGKVEVTVGEKSDMVFFSIKDTGIGISAEDKSKLFDKFFRSQKAIVNNPEGSGLGLYVVKSYIEGWGGKMSVESIEGKGSTFTISLPITKKEDTLNGGLK